jgi:hypothetical protein
METVLPPEPHPTVYRVEEPRAYPAHLAPEGAEPSPEIRRVAVLVVHGMGQQIEFETLDAVERGLRERERMAAGRGHPLTAARLVKLGEESVRRLEMTLSGPGGVKRDVHLYEAYWAPLTEGKVTLHDVLWLLWRASSLRKRPFERWIFGRRWEFDPHSQTVSYVKHAMFFVLAFFVLNAAALSALAISLIRGPEASWMRSALISDLSWPLAAVLLLALSFALLLSVRRRVKRKGVGTSTRAVESVLNFLIKANLWVIVAVTELGALAAFTFFFVHRGVSMSRFLPDLLGWAGGLPLFLLRAGLWGSFFLVAWILRGILVQYIGDVAAYIFPNALDRFSDLRTEIQTCVAKAARAIYTSGAGDAAEWQYDRVILVGHSLGSLIGYDTLNRLINEDALVRGRLHVLGRTPFFLTLGSPLDKTAFIFARQGEKRTSDAREALAATVQPLVQSYVNRTFRWVNVHSPHDIVSSELVFYDERGAPVPPAVENVQDVDAIAPFVAHVDYWKNPTLFKILHSAVTA